MTSLLKILLTIIVKNLKVIFRTKTSALIIIIGPLLIIGIVGIAFNSSQINDVRIGYYSSTKLSPSAQGIIKGMSDQQFKTFEMASRDNCINQVKSGNIHACIIFPEGFDLNNTNSQQQIEFAVDFSRMNIAWVITDTVMTQIKTQSASFSLQMISQMLDEIRNTDSRLLQSKDSLVQITSNGQQISLKITDMKSNLNALDLNISGEEVNASDMAQLSNKDISKQVDNFKSSLQDLQSNIDAASASYESQRKQSIASLVAFKDKMNSTRTTLVGQQADLQNQSAMLCQVPDSPECKLVLQQIAVIGEQVKTLDGYMAELDSSLQGMQQQAVSSQDIDDKFSKIDSNIDVFGMKIQQIQDSTSRFGSEFTKVKDKQQQLKDLQNSTLSNLDEVASSVDSNMNSLNSMLNDINDMSAQLESMNVSNSQAIIYPIKTSFWDIGEKGNYLVYLFPSLLILVVMLISILLSSTTVISEKESKAHFRNFLAPVNGTLFIVGHFISNSIIIMCQTLILLLVAVFAFNVPVHNWPAIIGAFLLINSLFILIGLFIGYFFNSEETATLGCISISCVLLFFSSTIVPIETMAKKVGFLAYANPFVLGESIIRRIIIFDRPLLESRLEFAVLSFYVIILFVCVVILYNYRKSKVGE